MFRDAADGVLLQLDVQPTKGTGILRHARVDGVEDADHRRGPGAGLGQVQAAGQRIHVVGQIDLDPRVLTVDIDGHIDRDAVLGRARHRVMAAGPAGRPARQLADRVDHPAFGVVEPLRREAVQRVPADLVGQRKQLALADTGGADHGEIVAPPLFRHADAHHAHAHQILVVAVVLLDLHTREDQRALVINVLGVAHVGRRLGVAAVGLMRFGQHGEMMRALIIDHRHDQRVIRRVAAAVIGRVVQEGIALLQLRMELLD